MRTATLATRVTKRRAVARTADFRRIEALPRRVWDVDVYELEELRVGLTSMLRGDARGVFRLNVIQAAALRDIHDHRGAFLPISVGGGKSLISLLAPVILEAKRPLLFVPASLRDQTKLKVIPEMSKHFKLHANFKVIGYSELSLAKNNDMLNKLQPDMIILDECHSVKNRKAGRTKRMHRYIEENPDTIVVAMSGTVSTRSLRDYQHIVRWCLGDLNTPLPIKWSELSDWSDALDEGVPYFGRIAPGALDRLCKDGENPRQGYRRRLTETPGVIASGDDELGVSLHIHRIKPRVPSKITAMLKDLRASWVDPNGDSLAQASDIWRVARQLGLGFWYKWIPSAPIEWLRARSAWKTYVRDTLSHNRRNLDTELQVWNECARDKTLPCWVSWDAIKHTFTPNPVPQWVDPFVVDEVKRWFAGSSGIVWVEHRAVGERLSEDLDVQYFGAGSKDSVNILDASGPIVASIRAHGQGKNLQRWHRNLVLSTPSSGKTWEQMLGRTHRPGQKSDTVTADVFLAIDEHVSAFSQAQSDARYLEDSLGGRQRLNYADIGF